MSFTNPNPNEPHYPYGGGSDNPGDDTSKPGGPTSVASVETGPLTSRFTDVRHSPIVAGLAQGGTDTVLPDGVLAVPPRFDRDLEAPAADRGTDTGGVTVEENLVRVSGQDETLGETETTTGEAPSGFPEPTP